MRLTFRILLTLILQPCLVEESSRSGNIKECTADYYLKGESCIPCPRGYFGVNCAYTCPYPTYGYRCLQGECLCSKQNCDPKNGCPKDRQYAGTSEFNRRTFSETDIIYKNKERHRPSQSTDRTHSTFIGPAIRKPVPITKNTQGPQYNFNTTVLVTAAGTFVSTLLLVAICVQVRSGIIFCRRVINQQTQMSSKNGKVYAEVQNINNGIG